MESMLYTLMIRELHVHEGFFPKQGLILTYVASQVSFMSRGYWADGSCNLLVRLSDVLYTNKGTHCNACFPYRENEECPILKSTIIALRLI